MSPENFQSLFSLCLCLQCIFLYKKYIFRINLPKSDLVPSQRKQHLGMVLDSVRALVFSSPERFSRSLSVGQSFLEHRAPTVSLWRSLLGHLASLERLVTGSWVHSQSLQWCLKKHRKAASVPPSQ
ncbi:hypothetical protein E2C01_042726 [Portunus trituberculatus]|uniref:Uncharacterized protein n=1 Tax=Portunus trituberculatus TaxID=210409 RepID=A0A5B7FMJ2_PORTR|nr:hypothetical protein [Portunus trituberculatus]